VTDVGPGKVTASYVLSGKTPDDVTNLGVEYSFDLNWTTVTTNTHESRNIFSDRQIGMHVSINTAYIEKFSYRYSSRY
jgi:hypothetical protein